jgi:hypothetical protein
VPSFGGSPPVQPACDSYVTYGHVTAGTVFVHNRTKFTPDPALPVQLEEIAAQVATMFGPVFGKLESVEFLYEEVGQLGVEPLAPRMHVPHWTSPIGYESYRGVWENRQAAKALRPFAYAHEFGHLLTRQAHSKARLPLLAKIEALRLEAEAARPGIEKAEYDFNMFKNYSMKNPDSETMDKFWALSRLVDQAKKKKTSAEAELNRLMEIYLTFDELMADIVAIGYAGNGAAMADFIRSANIEHADFRDFTRETNSLTEEERESYYWKLNIARSYIWKTHLSALPPGSPAHLKAVRAIFAAATALMTEAANADIAPEDLNRRFIEQIEIEISRN